MRILVVGDGGSPIHEVAVSAALQRLGHEVEAVYWSSWFSGTGAVARLSARIQSKLIAGPRVWAFNHALLRAAERFRPELVFVYRGTHVYASTLATLRTRHPGSQLFGYNNDDPFAPGQSALLWRHFHRGIPVYDIVFAYRPHNVADFLGAGARRSELLLPWYIPEQLKVLERVALPRPEFACDVVFVGHYEADDRLLFLERLVGAGVDLRLYGPDWDRAPALRWIDPFRPVRPLRGDDYYLALGSAKIVLSFFSTLNRDRYTRRSFEIPAAGAFMLSRYSPELDALFTEGEEAEYFRTPEELLTKVRRYLADDERRIAIAHAGRGRVQRDGHNIDARMRQVVALARAG